MSNKGNKRFLKVLLWSVLGLIVVVFTAIQVAMSPKYLTRIANKYAAEYVDGDVEFNEIKASVFKINQTSIAGKAVKRNLLSYIKTNFCRNNCSRNNSAAYR